jgi:hypothetical protein
MRERKAVAVTATIDYAAIRTTLGRGPSEGDLIGGRLAGSAGFAVRRGTVQCPDSVGFELDHELLNDMLESFALPVGNFDEPIILARRQFTLHENVSALREPFRQLREAFAERDHVMPLRPFLPLLTLVLPGLFVATENFVTGVPFARYLVSAFLPIKPMIES